MNSEEKIVGKLFEHELTRRGFAFSREPVHGRYEVVIAETTYKVSLDSLVRRYNLESNTSCISEFVDSALSSLRHEEASGWEEARKRILFCFEPNNYLEQPELRCVVSDRVDRVPILLNNEIGALVWISLKMIQDWGVSVEDIESAALENLSVALTASSIEYSEIDSARLGYFNGPLPFKSPLLLAPNLKTIVQHVIGWPVYAVIPDRDFVYIWAATNVDFASRVGSVVIREYSTAPYPITTEVFHIGDDGISAIGAFEPPAN